MSKPDVPEKSGDGNVSAPASGSTTPLLDAVREIEIMRSNANTKLQRLLESRGWKSTSQTPGCRWMLEKEINGRIILTDSQTALTHELETTD